MTASRPALRLGVVYDFRNPPDSGIPTPRLYAEILDQVAWLDGLGLDLVWFTEHHFVDDGYLPSWTPVAGAMAARTERVRFSSDICLLPFSHPVRLAEDLAVLDNLSGGRVEIGIGMGYAPHEFRGFGIPLPQRLSRTEEGLEVLRRCFTGERGAGWVRPNGFGIFAALLSLVLGYFFSKQLNAFFFFFVVIVVVMQYTSRRQFRQAPG